MSGALGAMETRKELEMGYYAVNHECVQMDDVWEKWRRI